MRFIVRVENASNTTDIEFGTYAEALAYFKANTHIVIEFDLYMAIIDLETGEIVLDTHDYIARENHASNIERETNIFITTMTIVLTEW